jgi:folylpolyglutamate synthase/dihydropteroate synthase
MQRVCPLLHVLWSTATCAQAVEKTVWRGRFSRHGYGALKDIIVDGAHNTDGAQALRAGLVNFPSTSRAWVLGMARHKNHLDVLSNLGIHEGDVVVACSFSPVESMPWVQPVSTEVLLATLHDLHSNQPTHSTETIAQALEWLNTENIQQVIVCGSLYLVADFYRLIQKCG